MNIVQKQNLKAEKCSNGKKYGFPLGFREGVHLDDGFDLDENSEDADGNDVDPRKKYEAGHIKPESITGDNSIKNFVPQDPKSNKEYSDTELVR